jgi:hypothetical protein
LTIIGFIYRLDLTQQWGCVIFPEYYLDTYRIVFDSISIFLLFTTIFIGNKRIRLYVLAGEFLFWLTVFLVYKGGYAVGIGGLPDDMVLLYDFTSMVIRLINIVLIVPFRANYKKWALSLACVGIALVLIEFKAQYLSYPLIEIHGFFEDFIPDDTEISNENFRIDTVSHNEVMLYEYYLATEKMLRDEMDKDSVLWAMEYLIELGEVEKPRINLKTDSGIVQKYLDYKSYKEYRSVNKLDSSLRDVFETEAIRQPYDTIIRDSTFLKLLTE